LISGGRGRRRAGAAAGAYIREVQLGKIDERQVNDEQQMLLLPLRADGKENPYLLQQQLQQAMQDGAGLARVHGLIALAIRLARPRHHA